jgi:hypothetical protein
MFKEEISNISNRNWMKRIDKYFINSSWGCRREGVGNDTENLVSEKTNVIFELLQISVS